MSRFYGKVGYVTEVDDGTGIWIPEIKEVYYRGDVTIDRVSIQDAQGINDNIDIQNSISILADAYAFKHYNSIRYVELDGIKWKVKSVRVQRPRLLLTLGGEYNDQNQ